MLFEIFRNACGMSTFWRLPKQLQSGGLVRPRLPLSIGSRGAMPRHAFRNFVKHVRDVSILEATNNLQSGELVRRCPSHCVCPRWVMVHFVSQHFRKYVPVVFIYDAKIFAACQRASKLSNRPPVLLRSFASRFSLRFRIMLKFLARCREFFVTRWRLRSFVAIFLQ